MGAWGWELKGIPFVPDDFPNLIHIHTHYIYNIYVLSGCLDAAENGLTNANGRTAIHYIQTESPNSIPLSLTDKSDIHHQGIVKEEEAANQATNQAKKMTRGGYSNRTRWHRGKYTGVE